MYNNKYIELNEVIKRFLKGYRTYSNDDKKIKDKFISKLKSICDETVNLEQCSNKLWEMICEKITMFNREILIYISEFIREMVCMNEFPKDKVDVMMNLNEIAIIMQKAIFANWDKFKNNRWYINAFYLCELRELIFLYKILEQNSQYIKGKNIVIAYDNIFEPIEDEVIDNYFDEYNKYFRTIKVEKETITNQKLNDYLDSKKLLPKHIKNSANYAIESTLGFNYNDLNILKSKILEFKSYEILNHHICISKEQFIKILSKYIELERVESIIKYLSINNLFTSQRIPKNREIELRCISQQNENLYFGIYNLLECISIFDNISFSGHYMDELGISENNKNKFTKLQQKFSTFFCYKIADLLDFNNYVLPQKDGIIQAEICEIPIGSNKKLNFKDIDVLAVDTQNNILYNFELKHFKIAMGYNRIRADRFDNKLFNSFNERNKVLEQHKDEILQSLFGITETQNYKLKPVLITSRANFKSREDIAYYTFESFKEMLKLKKVI